MHALLARYIRSSFFSVEAKFIHSGDEEVGQVVGLTIRTHDLLPANREEISWGVI